MAKWNIFALAEYLTQIFPLFSPWYCLFGSPFINWILYFKLTSLGDVLQRLFSSDKGDVWATYEKYNTPFPHTCSLHHVSVTNMITRQSSSQYRTTGKVNVTGASQKKCQRYSLTLRISSSGHQNIFKKWAQAVGKWICSCLKGWKGTCWDGPSIMSCPQSMTLCYFIIPDTGQSSRICAVMSRVYTQIFARGYIQLIQSVWCHML